MANRGRYASIYRALSSDPEFLALGPDARHLLLTLRITDLGNVAGIFICYQDAIRIQTGLPLKRLVRAFDELEGSAWVLRQGRLLWGRNFLKFEPTYTLADPNKKKGIENILESLPRLALVRRFAEYYKVICPEGVPDLVDSPKGPPLLESGSPSEAPPEGSPSTPPYQEQLTVNSYQDLLVQLTGASPGRRLVMFWKAALDHPGAKISPGRVKKVQKMLDAGFTEFEVAWGICGCGSSPYHMGENDAGTVHDGLALICREEEKLEWFRQFIKEEDARGIFQGWLKTGTVTLPQHLRGEPARRVAPDRAAEGAPPDGQDIPHGPEGGAGGAEGPPRPGPPE